MPRGGCYWCPGVGRLHNSNSHVSRNRSRVSSAPIAATAATLATTAAATAAMSWWDGCCDGVELAATSGGDLACTACGKIIQLASTPSTTAAKCSKRVEKPFQERERERDKENVRAMLDRLRCEEFRAQERQHVQREAAKARRRAEDEARRQEDEARQQAEDGRRRAAEEGAEIRRRAEELRRRPSSESPPAANASRKRPHAHTRSAPSKRRRPTTDAKPSVDEMFSQMRERLDGAAGERERGTGPSSGAETAARGATSATSSEPKTRAALQIGELARHVIKHRADAHACLGLTWVETTRIALRKRYLHLSRRLHPDKTPHPLARDAFLAVQAAFRLLHPTVS